MKRIALTLALVLIAQVAFAQNPAVVRVANAVAGSTSYGTGTLISKDAKYGVIITVAHVFTDGVGELSVKFPNNHTFGARLIRLDQQNDLAALLIVTPETEPMAVAFDQPTIGQRLTSCGYGEDGMYWCNEGEALQYVASSQQSPADMIEISGRARQGDSGGPVVNDRGELAAVLAATNGRIVVGTACHRIRTFLRGILPHRRQQPPVAAAPMVPVPPFVAATPPVPPSTVNPSDPPAVPDVLAEVPPAVLPGAIAALLPAIAGWTPEILTVLGVSSLGPLGFAAMWVHGLYQRRKRGDDTTLIKRETIADPKVIIHEKTQTENHYVDKEQYQIGEAFKEAIRREANVNPPAAPALERVEQTVKSLLAGEKAAWHLGWQG